MDIARRDLASSELWHRSLERSQRRRTLAAEARRQVALRKHAAIAMATAMLGGQAAPTALAAAGSSPGEASTQPAGTRTIEIKEGGLPLKAGSEGELVTAVQRALDLPADGIYGPQTEAAVHRFQVARGLLVDGVVGPATWGALFAAHSTGPASAAQTPGSAVVPDVVPEGAKREISRELRTVGDQTVTAALPASKPAVAEPPAEAAPRKTTPVTNDGGEATEPVAEPAPPRVRSLPVDDTTGNCGSGRISSPVRGIETSPYGPRGGRNHDGIDIAAPIGTIVRAAACGTVTLREQQSGYGNIVCITHSSQFSTCYAHLSAFNVSSGQSVRAGQVIGRVGCTGSCTGPHVHFETRVHGTARDPRPYLRGQSAPGVGVAQRTSAAAAKAGPARTRRAAATRQPAGGTTIERSQVATTASGGEWQGEEQTSVVAAQPVAAPPPAPTAAPVPLPAPAPVPPVAQPVVAPEAPAEEPVAVETAPAPVEQAAPVTPAPAAAPVEAAAPTVEVTPPPAEPTPAPTPVEPAPPAAPAAEPAPVEPAPVEPAPAEPVGEATPAAAAPVEAAPGVPAEPGQ